MAPLQASREHNSTRSTGERSSSSHDNQCETSGSSSDGDHVNAYHWHESMHEGSVVSSDSGSVNERRGKWNFMLGNGRETLRQKHHLSDDIVVTASGISGGRLDREDSSILRSPSILQSSQSNLQNSRRLIFNPESSRGLLYWDVVVCVTIFIVALCAPFEALFTQPRLGDRGFIRRRVLDLILVADMVMQLFIAFPDHQNRQGRIVTCQKVIVRNYLSGWFVVDIMGIFPVDCVLIWASTKPEYRDIISSWFLFRALRLFRMLTLLRLMRILGRYENKFGLSFAKLTLCKFFFITLLACHWMACVWGSLAIHLSDGNTPTWYGNLRVNGDLLHADELEGDEFSVYSMSVYWAIITLTSIGYGDVTPQNDPEFLVATICSGVMASIWAYVIGTVCGIVSTLDPHEISFKRNFDDLNWMMADVDMPSDMAQRFRKYFIEAKEMNKQRIENTVIDQMSPQLQGECAMFLHKKWIEKVWYLQTMSNEVVVWAARHLTVMVYAPNEEVLPERTLFIVRHGVCASAGRILIGGDIWGQDMLISNEHLRNKHTVRALSYLHVLKLHITDLSDIVLVFPDARQQLRAAQVKISFTRGFKMVAREVEQLGKNGLPWWEVPPEWRPLLYAQILHGCYTAEDWLQRRWECVGHRADNAENADRGGVRQRTSTVVHTPVATLKSSSTKDVLDSLVAPGMSRAMSAVDDFDDLDAPAPRVSLSHASRRGEPSSTTSQDILNQLRHSSSMDPQMEFQSARFSRHQTMETNGTSQDLNGSTMSVLAEQLMALERNVAALTEKVERMSEPAVQNSRSSVMRAEDSTRTPHRDPSFGLNTPHAPGEQLSPGGVVPAWSLPSQQRSKEFRRRQLLNAEIVDFGSMHGLFGTGGHRMSNAMNAGFAGVHAGFAGVQEFSSSSKRMANQIAAGFSEKILPNGHRPTT